jgi:stage V sporulation protein B
MFMPEQIKENLKKQTISGSFWNVSASMVQKIGGLIFTVLLARILLPEKFGIYSLVISIAMLFTVFSEGGINSAVIRFISELRKDKKKASGYFNYLVKLKLIILIISSVLLILFAFPLSFLIFDKPFILIPLIFSSVYIIAYSLLNFFSSLFFSIKKVKYLFFKETVYQILRTAIIILTILIIPSLLDVSYTIILITFCSFVALLYVIYLSRKAIPEIFVINNSIKDKDKKRIIKFSFYSTFISLSYLLLGNMDALILGAVVSDAKQIGLYRSAFTLVSSIGGIFAFSQVLLPIFVSIKNIKLEQAFNKIVKYFLIFAVPLTFGLIILADYLLVLVYGYEYLGAKWPLIFLALMIIPNI